MLSALTDIYLASLTLTDSIQIFDGVSVSLGSLILLILFLSVLSLILSLVALGRVGRGRKAASQAAAISMSENRKPALAAAVPRTDVTDPALIAVLTAAVYMMLGAAVTAKTGQKSKAGFTIRTVRRV